MRELRRGFFFPFLLSLQAGYFFCCGFCLVLGPVCLFVLAVAFVICNPGSGNVHALCYYFLPIFYKIYIIKFCCYQKKVCLIQNKLNKH
jgi:hypothetical protein